MHIAFFHEKFPFGGGEAVTSGIVKGLHHKYPEVKTTVFAIKPMSGANSDVISSTSEEIASKATKLGVDVLVVAFSTRPSLFKRIKSEAPHIKVVFHLHSQPMWQVRHKMGQGRLKYWLERLFGQYTRRYLRHYREIFRAADAIVTLCPTYAKVLQQIVGDTGGDDSKIVSIYNPMSLPKTVSSHEKEIIYVGRLSGPDKRVDRLLRIWQKAGPSHPDWKLTIVGDGPQMDSLIALGHELGLQRIAFAGHTAAPERYYSRASVLCLTSEYEGWPLVLAEAMAYGVKCIAFDCSAGVHELLADGRGVLITPGGEEKYATELSRMISGEPALSDPTPLLARLTPESVAGRWMELSDKLCLKK